jgi:hypothetical protein
LKPGAFRKRSTSNAQRPTSNSENAMNSLPSLSV